MWNRGGNPRAGSNASNRPVCPFFLEGRCKFGDSCRNYHPPQAVSSTQNQNRFGALSGSTQGRNQSLPYHLNADAIKADLTEGDEKPGWPLSCYGPGRDAPRQLIEAALEQSPEELRVQYYLAKTSGSTQQYEQTERTALEQASQLARQVLNDIDGAIKFVIDGKDQHPNREDFVQRSGNFNWAPAAGATQVTPVAGSTFGKPSTFGAASGGGGAFGQPTAPSSSSSFGQPSGLGSMNAANSNGAPGFGQASNLGSSSGAFGRPSVAPSAFGQPLGLGTGAPSGQASAFGSGTSPFAAAATNSSPFGQQSSNNVSTGASAFGQPSMLGTSATPSAPVNASPFATQGAPASTGGSSFGQPSNSSQQSTFGRPSPFGAAATAGSTSAFGQPSNMGAQSTPFGTAPPSAASQATFGNPSAGNQLSNPFGSSVHRPSPLGAANPSNGPLTTFKGRPVEHLRVAPNDPSDTTMGSFYTNAQGRKERIWMPDGPPGSNADVEGPPDIYQGEAGTVLKQVYDFAQQSEMGFKEGFVPEIPPKREWVSFEL